MGTCQGCHHAETEEALTAGQFYVCQHPKVLSRIFSWPYADQAGTYVKKKDLKRDRVHFVGHDLRPTLLFGPDFGCVHWEQKTG